MAARSIQSLKETVASAVRSYNEQTIPERRIERVSLFGSYAEGRPTESSDVDLLVKFASPAVSLLCLGRVLETFEESLRMPVDLVQDPLPDDSLLDIGAKVVLYG